MLSMIAGLIPPTRGTVTVDGAPVRSKSGDVGYMLQRDTLNIVLTVAGRLVSTIILSAIDTASDISCVTSSAVSDGEKKPTAAVG